MTEAMTEATTIPSRSPRTRRAAATVAVMLLAAPVLGEIEFAVNEGAGDAFRRVGLLRSVSRGSDGSQGFSIEAWDARAAVPIGAVLSGETLDPLSVGMKSDRSAARAETLAAWRLLERDVATADLLGGVRIGASFGVEPAGAAAFDQVAAPFVGGRARMALDGGAVLEMRAGVTGAGSEDAAVAALPRGAEFGASIEVPLDARWSASVNAGWRERDGWWDAAPRDQFDRGAVWFGLSASF
jgi:hypothetical protein